MSVQNITQTIPRCLSITFLVKALSKTLEMVPQAFLKLLIFARLLISIANLLLMCIKVLLVDWVDVALLSGSIDADKRMTKGRAWYFYVVP